MLASFLVLMVVLFFVIGAVRILFGWFAPSGAVASFDRLLDIVSKGSLRVLVLMVGLFILAAIVFGFVNG